MSVDLPDPDTPVTATNKPERDVDVDVPQVVLARAFDANRSRCGSAFRRRSVGIGIDSSPRRYLPGDRCS